MDYRFSSWIFGGIAGVVLWCTPPSASAKDLCARGEATAPQPQHINGPKTFTYKAILEPQATHLALRGLVATPLVEFWASDTSRRADMPSR